MVLGTTDLGLTNYGGVNSPYVWAEYPGRKSWDVFTEILEGAHVVTTPGSGFGPSGEGFIRFSALRHRADVVEAVRRLKESTKPGPVGVGRGARRINIKASFGF
jgi:LL-diaminopimelate aminotransferase